MNPNLRRHQLVQQRAEKGGESCVLALVDGEFPVNTINTRDDLVLFFGRRHRDGKAPQPRRANIALANGSRRDGL